MASLLVYFGFIVSNLVVQAQSQQSDLVASRLTTTLQPTPSGTVSSGALNVTSGVITSPGYPNNYPSNTSFEKKLTVGLSKVILIEFEDFDVEEDSDCGYDKLIVQELVGTKFKTAGKFCGSKVPKPFRTRSNVVRIVFTSDESENRKGFKLKWKSVTNKRDCGTTKFNSTSGTIQSPGFPNSYENSISCTYSIQVQRGYRIAISIIEVGIEYSSGCKYDALSIHEARNSGEAILGKFCGTKPPMNDILSTSNRVLLKFTSDDSTNGKGFNITWTSERPFTETGRGTCGRKYHFATRIIGGTAATAGEFPWHAGFFWRTGIAKGKYFCGGALMNRQWILTAAHCFVNGRNTSFYEVKLGDQNLRADDGREQVFNISEIIVHPRYNMVTYDNDVALVELRTAANLTDFVNTICLPRDASWPGMRCMIAGWGATMEHGRASDVLIKAEVPIVDKSVCARADVYGSKITRNMICAGYAHGGIDTCQGDSGGPLHCQNKENPNIWEIQGIASWGRGCGRQLRYGVYTKVHNFAQWINCIIQQSDRVLNPRRASNGTRFCGESGTDINVTRAYTKHMKTATYEWRPSKSALHVGNTISASKDGSHHKSDQFLETTFISLSSDGQNIIQFSGFLSSFIKTSSISTTARLQSQFNNSTMSLGARQSSISLSINPDKHTETMSNGESVLPTHITNTEEQTRIPSTLTITMGTQTNSRNFPITTELSKAGILSKVPLMETTAKSTTATTQILPSYMLVSALEQKSGTTKQIAKPDSMTSGLFILESMMITEARKNTSYTKLRSTDLAFISNTTVNNPIVVHSSITSSGYAATSTVIPKARSKGSTGSPSAVISIALAFLVMRYC